MLIFPRRLPTHPKPRYYLAPLAQAVYQVHFGAGCERLLMNGADGGSILWFGSANDGHPGNPFQASLLKSIELIGFV
jgi:hypothetical protein